MRMSILSTAALAAGLSLGGCATTGDAPVDVRGAEVASRTLDNGDVLEEYRVGDQLRMVKIIPLRGPAYYLYDRNGDGVLDADGREELPQVYWKLFEW